MRKRYENDRQRENGNARREVDEVWIPSHPASLAPFLQRGLFVRVVALPPHPVTMLFNSSKFCPLPKLLFSVSIWLPLRRPISDAVWFRIVIIARLLTLRRSSSSRALWSWPASRRPIAIHKLHVGDITSVVSDLICLCLLSCSLRFHGTDRIRP